MSNTMLKKLKRKPKWKLEEEKGALQLEQKKLRMETDELTKNLLALMDDEIKAMQGNDGATIALVEAKIQTTKDKIAENDKRYKANVESLETYTKALKNDLEGRSSRRNSVVGVITGIGGLALGAIGLKLSYDSDIMGTLHNKKALDWTKSLPIFRNFGKK